MLTPFEVLDNAVYLVHRTQEYKKYLRKLSDTALGDLEEEFFLRCHKGRYPKQVYNLICKELDRRGR